ncbi:FkbM family methyltransferase [Pseudomonas sp. NPDC087346]|uniref:FkbM family methyltransferase n=1 Tax=Pseudomonas sp. NPDC087346 TaxID=3364438 RepID=UPI0037F1DBE4
MTKTCILDIGANNGDFLLPVATRSPGIPVIGIEPIPELYRALEEKKDSMCLSNIKLLKAAIDVTPCRTTFNVARHADWGVSSLLPFNASSITNDEYWKERSDLYFDEVIDVDVIRLDSLLEREGYDHISFIKIDAQGVDLRVLESLGEYLPSVDAGMLETPTTSATSLYNGEPALFEVLSFLDKNGFEPFAIKSNDPACAEVNVFFNRKGVSWREVEDNLKLRGVALYDGKHYWHVASDSPTLPPGDPVSLSIQQELARARHYVAENSAAWARVLYWKAEATKIKNQLDSELRGVAGSHCAEVSSTDENNRLRYENNFLKSHIEAIHRSTSWKLSAPLRALKKFIR